MEQSPVNLEFQKERALRIFDSMIAISVAGFKLLALLNGGAAVALLAYLGNITAKVNTGLAGAVLVPPDLKGPMSCFIIGLVFCAGAFGLSYRTQFILWNEATGVAVRGLHRACLVGAAVCCLLSIAAFAIGAFWAASVF